MPAGPNGFRPVCQHGDISANEEEKQPRETHGRPGPLTNGTQQSGSLLLLMLVITEPGFFPFKVFSSGKARRRADRLGEGGKYLLHCR